MSHTIPTTLVVTETADQAKALRRFVKDDVMVIGMYEGLTGYRFDQIAVLCGMTMDDFREKHSEIVDELFMHLLPGKWMEFI